MDLYAILFGVFGGIIWGLMGAGYHKMGNPDFKFSFWNFFKTVVLGAVIGGYSSYMGQPVEVFSTTLTATFITGFVDRIVNIIKKAITK